MQYDTYESYVGAKKRSNFKHLYLFSEEAPATIVVPGTIEEVLHQTKNGAVLNPDPALDLAHDKNKVPFMTNFKTIPTF